MRLWDIFHVRRNLGTAQHRGRVRASHPAFTGSNLGSVKITNYENEQDQNPSKYLSSELECPSQVRHRGAPPKISIEVFLTKAFNKTDTVIIIIIVVVTFVVVVFLIVLLVVAVVVDKIIPFLTKAFDFC